MPVVIDYTDSGTTGILILSPSGYPGNGSPLDLSRYMRAAADAGMDPANPEFTQKVFSHALLKEGGVQALESFQLKEMQFPLAFNATTRDGVTQLIQEVNNMINAAGQTVSWQDQGVSQPTYFDLASGQFDPEYDFRRAERYWIYGKLRLFVQPLGHTATMRLIASAAGTGPLLTLPIASPILGDAPALIQTTIQGGSSYNPKRTAVSVIPAGYQPLFAGASLLQGLGGDATSVGASGAVASQLWRSFYPPGSNGTVALAYPAIGASSIIGRNRLLGVVRTNHPSSAFQVISAAGVSFTCPTAYAVGTDWNLVDFGTISVPSSFPYGYYDPMVVFLAASSAATQTADMSALIVLPDNTTVFMDESLSGYSSGAAAWYFFDGVQDETSGWDGSLGNPIASPILGDVPMLRLTPQQRGAIPKLPPSEQQASSQIAVISLSATGSGGNPQPANETISALVYVRERVRFAF